MKPYTHFTLFEREYLQESLKEGKSFRKIAEELGRSPSSISREVKRNFSKKKKRYHPWRATVLYITRRKNCHRKPKIVAGTKMYEYISKCLQEFWSPEVIAERCKWQGYNVSCSTIYRAIKNQTFERVSVKTHLRRKGKKKYGNRSNFSTIHPEHTIHERPEIVENKDRIGDWEGDTVFGKDGKGCIVTNVDRKSKYLTAAKSDSKDKLSVREAFKNAFRTSTIKLPIHTLTLDNGSEFADFKGIEQDLNTTIYFADPHSPWQRGLNENTNGILRFFFPKGTDFHKLSQEDLDIVVSLINNRPRKCLGYLSPIEFISKKCCT